MISRDQCERLCAILIGFISDKAPANIAEFEDYYGSMFPNVCSMMLGNKELDEEEQSYIHDKVRDSISFPLRESKTIASENVLNDRWLNELDIDFRYSDRYFSYLISKKNRDCNSIDILKKDSLRIIQMLGNPNIDKTQHRKGLMIGDVQSGKTESYTAVLNRAVDAGYDVIILLTGTTSVLRAQTQQRIDNDLIGLTVDKKEKRYKLCGVGEVKSDLIKISPITSVVRDFSKALAQTTPVQIQKGKTILIVTKKNVSTLSTIYDSLLAANRNISINSENDCLNASLLLVDDEADNASVNTNKPETNPTAINQKIRNLMNLFARSGYLAVTATPFANIFIDDEEDAQFGEDLFPSDFITLIDRPHSYTGARDLFGEVDIPESEKKFGNKMTFAELCLKEILDSEMESTYKYKHKKTLTVSSAKELPPSMMDAIRYFIIVQALMDILPAVDKHRTMMINVSRYVDVQNNLFMILNTWLNEVFKPQFRKYAMMPEYADNQNTGEFYNLKRVWDENYLAEISGIDWSEFCSLLDKNLLRLRVTVVNNGRVSKDGKGINYDLYPEGDRVIAVGGQCLSRGLTLEGLVVSYFYRNSAAYDTLLQMGRWFGYRENYLKYFRVWMSSKSQSWYQMISDAAEDLRLQIDTMNDRECTPRQYGLMVKFHPCTGLIITARSKMQGVKKSDRRIATDLRGRLIESARLSKAFGDNKANAYNVESFIESIGREPEHGRSGVYWKDIDRERIAGFVGRFASQKMSLGFQVSELEKYINKSSTPKWDVAIAQTSSNPGSEFLIPCLVGSFTMIPRFYEEIGDTLFINEHHVRIGTGSVPAISLDEDIIKNLKAFYKEDWEKAKNISSTYLKNIKDVMMRNSILILYPLYLKKKEKGFATGDVYNNPTNDPVWAIGLGFAGERPALSKSDCYSYALNIVAQRLEWDLDEEEDDDIDEE